MDPQDDPEERIRQLEQTGGANRPTELGVDQSSTGYSYVPPTASDSYVPPTTPSGLYPPPTQPWSYPPPSAPGFPAAPGYLGAPFPVTTRTGSGRWMLFLPILIGMIALAGGVIFFVSQMSHGIGSITTNPGGFSTAFPTVRPSIPRVVPTPPASPTTAPQGGDLSVSGIDETKTIACNDSIVTVSGSSNNITITGHCASVSVSGIDNVVTVDAADEISASGIDNRVAFHSGSPQVENSGPGNVIEQG